MRPKARVLRDGRETSVATESVVPGDVVLLSAGSLVPADGVVLEAADFFVSEASPDRRELPGRETPRACVRRGPAARALELRLSRHQRPQRHRPLPDRPQPGGDTEFGAIAAPADAAAAG